jgi:hypothetical protein
LFAYREVEEEMVRRGAGEEEWLGFGSVSWCIKEGKKGRWLASGERRRSCGG